MGQSSWHGALFTFHVLVGFIHLPGATPPSTSLLLVKVPRFLGHYLPLPGHACLSQGAT
jgi:hypothetical protein